MLMFAGGGSSVPMSVSVGSLAIVHVIAIPSPGGGGGGWAASRLNFEDLDASFRCPGSNEGAC